MKTKIAKYVLLVSILFFQTKLFSANWTVVHTVSNRLIWNIAFADNNTVYAVGDSLLMKSIDGGNNWIDLLPNISSLTTDKKFFNLRFLNKDTGFVFRNTFTDNLYMTTDGGITWSNVPSALPYGLLDIDFANESIGYAVGGIAFPNYPDSVISKTIDGGHTWTNIPKPTLCQYPMAVHFLTDNIGFTGDEEIYKTIDGGNTWTLSSTPAGWPNTGSNNTRITDYKFLTNQIGFAITDNWNYYKTIDGGNTWEQKQLPVSGISGCRGIAFDQNNFGYILGYGLFQPFISNDAGDTWQIDGTFSAYFPTTCIATSTNHKVIVGTRDGDVVLKENAPLSTSAFNANSEINIYPNPTTGIFNIHSNTQIISIEIINLLGATVYKDAPVMKNNELKINLTNLPKGIYIVKIDAENNSIQQKLLLQ